MIANAKLGQVFYLGGKSIEKFENLFPLLCGAGLCDSFRCSDRQSALLFRCSLCGRTGCCCHHFVSPSMLGCCSLPFCLAPVTVSCFFPYSYALLQKNLQGCSLCCEVLLWWNALHLKSESFSRWMGNAFYFFFQLVTRACEKLPSCVFNGRFSG